MRHLSAGSDSKRNSVLRTRRDFLGEMALLIACTTGMHSRCMGRRSSAGVPPCTRGLILYPGDIMTVPEWPALAKDAGLTTLGIHSGGGGHSDYLSRCVDFVKSPAGQKFLEQCDTLGVHVEYEIHAMEDLLPRDLFDKDPSMFRTDEKGQRQRKYNCCVHSENALDVICKNTIDFARLCRPTTGRYFLWIDDGRFMCRCPKCRDYSDSEQALILENRMLKALRTIEKSASLAHLAYAKTLQPPNRITPDPGIFLEYAPIMRDYSIPYEKQGEGYKQNLTMLDANLKVFPRETAQVLEYWTDVSKFSGWKRPFKKLPWRPDVFRADVRTYKSKGIRHITAFGCGFDRYYFDRYGIPPIQEYGAGLQIIG